MVGGGSRGTTAWSVRASGRGEGAAPFGLVSSMTRGASLGSDVVLRKQHNTCKCRDYVGQASCRYRNPARYLKRFPARLIPGE